MVRQSVKDRGTDHQDQDPLSGIETIVGDGSSVADCPQYIRWYIKWHRFLEIGILETVLSPESRERVR